MSLAASFRDPGGFVVVEPDRVLRYVHTEGIGNLTTYLTSASVQKLVGEDRVIGTRTGSGHDPMPHAAAHVEHDRIPFPSYPYEWPAEMLFAAAELTLDIAERTLEEGVGLKDATPYNVLFHRGKPVFIDILSFERRNPCDPIWLAGAQFHRTFLLPLLAHRYLNLPLHQIFQTHRDGLTPAEMRPWVRGLKAFLPPLLGGVTIPELLGRFEGHVNYKARETSSEEESKFILSRYLRHLRRRLQRLEPRPAESLWSRYTSHCPSYTPAQSEIKKAFICNALRQIEPSRTLDIGCNTGEFSMVAARHGAVVAIDHDPVSAGRLWKRVSSHDMDILPLVVDIGRPSPALGWRNAEQLSFLDRCVGSFDCVLMLALVHHLLASEQVPLPDIFHLASQLTKKDLLIEYVGPEDPMFRRLDRGRDLHAGITAELFEREARRWFRVMRCIAIPDSHRRLYWMRQEA